MGWLLVSTGGTSTTLQKAGLAVRSVSDVTGFPEMIDGRVKTLHPAVHAGILARRARPDDMAALAASGLAAIDLVVVNLYPFAATAARPDVTLDDLTEQIDIGGPTMIRAAAKSFRDVLVAVDPDDYPSIADDLAAGRVGLDRRFALARKAFAHTAAYDATIAATLPSFDVAGFGATRQSSLLPPVLSLGFSKIGDLRYGENPHQPAAWYREAGADGFGRLDVRQGKELSYTNLLDLDAAARLVLEFAEPCAAVIKHTNPCGVATAERLADAYERARDADSLSAFGGIVAANRAIDEATARAITSTFIEAVVAPGVDPEAVPILAAKPNLRVVTADFSRFQTASTRDLRAVLGAILVQERDRVDEARAEWPGDDADVRVATVRAPSVDEWRALRFAWRIAAHVKSNAVIFTRADRTSAIGAGQMSRVDAVGAARLKGGDALRGTVAASDAFFPFRDGVDAIAEAGATAIVQPGGSRRDEEVIAAANEHDLAMVFTGRRHFRH